MIKVANSGQRALDIVSKSKPDLILLDVMMPEMDGYEVCKRLKENKATQDIPVIFITARVDVEDETRGFELGAVDYINKPISAPIVLARIKTHLSLTKLESYDHLARAAIHMLAEAGHYNDTDTGFHIWRMAAYSKLLAIAAGWSEDEAYQLELAATMHDTGKIGIDDNILKAPRQLTSQEWIHMKKHSTIGSSMLEKSEHPIFKLSAIIAKRHHEKYDGGGYPDGLVGEEIPQSARIVAIADVFDALTMKRVYKSAWSVEDALKEIKSQAGKHFDPELVNLFLANSDEIKKIKEIWEEKERIQDKS